MLVLASFYGYAAVVEELLGRGANPSSRNMGGISAIHAACLGLSRVSDRTLAGHERLQRAIAVLSVLAHGGADRTELKPCEHVAAQYRAEALVQHIARLREA